ncbi:MAG: hypothetical protein U9O63_03030, partial [Actinomycetota bacterium]|nr:hypothetical protein [Actinomycetota bacterium]
MARSTRSRYLALVACLTLFLAGVPGVGTSLAQSVEPTNPWVGIAPDGDAMWGGSGWTQGNTVAISIDDPDLGDDDYATNVTVGPDEWNLQLEGVFDIQPGHLVTATDTDAGITKSHEVRGFTVDSVDTDADTVAGMAPVGTALTVKTFSPESCDTIATADQDGNWKADFAGLVSEGGQPCDLGPGWHGSAEWYDATDNDHTLMGWGVEDAPTPTFTVETPFDVWSSSDAWVEGDTITLAIGGYTDTTTVERWGPEPWEIGFNFHTEGGTEIIAGDTVTITATTAGTVKTLDVVAVTVTAVDEVGDTVSGTAPADSRVEVNGGNEFGGAHRSVQANGSGVWTADFSTPGVEDHEQDALDIAPGVGGSAEVYDDDQDSTHRGWRVASPWIGVDVTHDELWANDWPLGETLHYTIEDPDTATSPDKSGDMLVVTGGGGQTEAGDRMFDGFDIHAGQVLTVWSGTMSKELLISNLEVTDVDPDTDTMFGTADPGAEVCASTFNAQFCVNTDQNGDWIADFSTVGGNVRPGDHNSASQEDDDGDQTHFSWGVPPWIYVELAERDASGNDLYPDR